MTQKQTGNVAKNPEKITTFIVTDKEFAQFKLLPKMKDSI